MSIRLSEYISISYKKPIGDDVFFSFGRWLKLNVPFSKWKEPLRSRWSRLGRVLFAAEKEPSSAATKKNDVSQEPTGEVVCLCAHVQKCPMKAAGEFNQLCPKFAFGICVEGTLASNDNKPLSFATIGYLTGVSKQRVEQIYSIAQQRLVEEIKKDPVLVEYCMTHGIGGE